MLFPKQKQHYMELCQKHSTRWEEEGIVFLQRIITIDETWVCDFEPELKKSINQFKRNNWLFNNQLLKVSD